MILFVLLLILLFLFLIKIKNINKNNIIINSNNNNKIIILIIISIIIIWIIIIITWSHSFLGTIVKGTFFHSKVLRSTPDCRGKYKYTKIVLDLGNGTSYGFLP